MLAVNLTSPDFYINREVALLDFNRRVLAQAQDASLPLLERIRFLCISCSNLDEFFEIRVAGLKQLQALGASSTGPDGMTVAEQLKAIRHKAVDLVADQYELLNHAMFRELAAHGVRFLNSRKFTEAQGAWLAEYFTQQIEPVLTPLSLDPARPFPRIQNKTLNFIVRLSGKDVFGRDADLAIVQVPRTLPRLIQLPATFDSDGASYFVLLSHVIAAFVGRLFSGLTMVGSWQF